MRVHPEAIFLLAYLAVATMGCRPSEPSIPPVPRIQRLYPGKPLPRSEVAVLFVREKWIHETSLTPVITRVDQTPVIRNPDGIIIVAPGQRKLEIDLSSSRISATSADLEVYAEAGHAYEVSINAKDENTGEELFLNRPTGEGQFVWEPVVDDVTSQCEKITYRDRCNVE